MNLLLIITTTSFLLLKHPLSMGFMIILMTILISLTTGMLNLNFWFSYILFLVLIGGMLILFIYMTSIASNEKFKFSGKMLIINLMISSILLIISENSIFVKMKNYNFISNEMENMTNLKYFSTSMTMILISAMIYLLITLIMIVKMTKKDKGPIRQK
uniref:NADH-ubiquinone oxidoreductase chain 6 n=1 Tax=Colasposoma sp. EMHAU-15070314 TaxID=2480060 RepID=A0A3G3C756_9CUCU|nr:NADH dehydrogenase subunit 6 [Colasposoma sp. EMHAU-15070314]